MTRDILEKPQKLNEFYEELKNMIPWQEWPETYIKLIKIDGELWFRFEQYDKDGKLEYIRERRCKL